MISLMWRTLGLVPPEDSRPTPLDPLGLQGFMLRQRDILEVDFPERFLVLLGRSYPCIIVA